MYVLMRWILRWSLPEFSQLLIPHPSYRKREARSYRVTRVGLARFKPVTILSLGPKIKGGNNAIHLKMAK
jgi:hypothetical protein